MTRRLALIVVALGSIGTILAMAAFMASEDWTAVLSMILEVVGVGVVVVDLEGRPSQFGGTPGPIRSTLERARRFLYRQTRTVVLGAAAIEVSVALSARASVRPGPVPEGATLEDRVKRLEKYLDEMDKDRAGDRAEAAKALREARADVGKQHQELRSRIDELDRRFEALALGGLSWAVRGVLITGLGVILGGASNLLS